jgi:hypothetical protein
MRRMSKPSSPSVPAPAGTPARRVLENKHWNRLRSITHQVRSQRMHMRTLFDEMEHNVGQVLDINDLPCPCARDS